jgi:hypothetical protein
LVLELEQRQAGLAQELRTGTAVAGRKLVEALQNGMEQLPVSPRLDAVAQAAEACGGRLVVARSALQQLDEQLEMARRRLAVAERGVSAAVIGLVVDHAVSVAEDIQATDTRLFQQRRDLWSLSAAVNWMQRQLREPASVPPVVHRAVGSAADGVVDPAWAEKLKKLHSDPEAELE